MRRVRSRVGDATRMLAAPGARGHSWDDSVCAALDAVMVEHGDAVLRLAFSYVHDHGLAQDIAQETFLRWLRHHNELDPTRTRGWLLSVAANLGRDQLRSWSHRHLSLTNSVPDATAEAGPDEVAIARDDARRLTEAVMALPVPFREVVHLRYYEHLDANEIAELLAIPPSTVRTRLLRARRELHRALWKERDGV